MSNDVVIEAWTTGLFEKYLRFKYSFIGGYTSTSEEALKRHEYGGGFWLDATAVELCSPHD